jgi:hypothetical protein
MEDLAGFLTKLDGAVLVDGDQCLSPIVVAIAGEQRTLARGYR